MAEFDINGDNGFSIKQWAESDRPREKLMLKGRHSLSDAELIGILIASGSRSESAVQLSQRILKSVNNDLNQLGKLSVKDLMAFKGIGEAKAISIVSALELGRRRKESAEGEKIKVTSSQVAFEQVYPFLADLDHEFFYVILLNRANIVLETVRISQGGVTGTVADSKTIFKAALDRLACGVILSHNHPSGNLQPSTSDINLTQTMVKAGKILDINVLDHIIVAGKSYYSFADNGLL
ncbi:MAG: DNA repair protein RadC [Salibacteraceae bacterium]